MGVIVWLDEVEGKPGKSKTKTFFVLYTFPVGSAASRVWSPEPDNDFETAFS